LWPLTTGYSESSTRRAQNLTLLNACNCAFGNSVTFLYVQIRPTHCIC